MTIRKIIMPVASLIASSLVFVAGMIRQFSPQGNILTGSIIIASAVNVIRSAAEIGQIQRDEEMAVHADPAPIIAHAQQVHDMDVESQERYHFRNMVLTQVRSNQRRESWAEEVDRNIPLGYRR